MTEMAPISGTTALAGVRPGSVGKAIPCNDVQVVDLETGTRVLPPGERGEVRVRGPHMMTGYRDRPDETAQTVRNGYIYTGDIGHLDADGFLFITDRRKDVVFVKGYNVFPPEIEEVRYKHANRPSGVVAWPTRAPAASAWSRSWCPARARRSRKRTSPRTAQHSSRAINTRPRSASSSACP